MSVRLEKKGGVSVRMRVRQRVGERLGAYVEAGGQGAEERGAVKRTGQERSRDAARWGERRRNKHSQLCSIARWIVHQLVPGGTRSARPRLTPENKSNEKHGNPLIVISRRQFQIRGDGRKSA